MFEWENLREIELNIRATTVSKGSVATGYVNHSNHKTAPVNKTAKMPTERLKQTCNVQLIN